MEAASASEPVRHQSGDQTDEEFEDKGFGRGGDIDRVEQIADGHADGARQSSRHAAEEQRRQHAERIAEVERGEFRADRHLDLQERESEIRERRHDADFSDQQRGIFTVVELIHEIRLLFKIQNS